MSIISCITALNLNGVPLNNATVSAGGKEYVTKTNVIQDDGTIGSDGMFRIRNLPDGEHTIFVNGVAVTTCSSFPVLIDLLGL